MKLIKNKYTEITNPVVDILKVDDDYVLTSEQEDITSTETIKCYGRSWWMNYAEVKDCYQYLGKNFNNLSSLEQEQVVYHCAIPDQSCITYYVMSGLSVEEATQKYLISRSNDIIALSIVCQENSKNSNVIRILLEYMEQSEAERFLEATQALVFNYANYVVYGKKYGNYIKGILDYIEDYGDYEGTGLSTYTLRPGKLLANLVSELKSLLTNNRCNI
jgi:hypothetical protein